MTAPTPNQYTAPQTPGQEAVATLIQLADQALDEYKFSGPTENYVVSGPNAAGRTVAGPMILSPETGDIAFDPDHPATVDKVVYIPDRNERIAKITQGDGTVFYRHDNLITGYDTDSGRPGSFVTFWREGGDSIATGRVFTSPILRNYADNSPQPEADSTLDHVTVIRDSSAVDALAAGLKRSLDERTERNKNAPLHEPYKIKRNGLLGKIGLKKSNYYPK